jgi:hypothetical protein
MQPLKILNVIGVPMYSYAYVKVSNYFRQQAKTSEITVRMGTENAFS